MLYLTFKWLHLLAIISWMAGILYLFRLFVYHAEKSKSQNIHELLAIMELRLYRYITMPAMIAAWVFGLALMYVEPSLLKQGWLHTKILFVLALSGTTGYAGGLRRKFANNQITLSGIKLRVLNELPTILMMIIVALVVFKPF
jgi:putative membrane protein